MAQRLNCNSNLNSISIYKSFLSYKGYSNIECKSCGSLIVHSAKNRLYGGLIVGTSILMSFLYFGSKNPSVENVLIGIGIAAIIFLLGSLLITPLLQFENK
ncbi:hypothetical protein ACFSYG_12300 [Leeuwenhoekiella polynyae]|uniref:hypothetical protein n=1 Tax=Leeuwenhoekiella polynyae TaxID=1550906 RepID=UPI000FFEE9A2|nr:hypothetical protein [Leeuwenhoekiella polynyae]